MRVLPTITIGRSVSPDLPIKIGLFALWLAIAVWLAMNHVIWRDEMRALSIALQGDHLTGMLQGLHGEGHPALWYLLLRGVYLVFGRLEVLPGVTHFAPMEDGALVARSILDHLTRFG